MYTSEYEVKKREREIHVRVFDLIQISISTRERLLHTNKMITVRINLFFALVTVIILISSFEIQRGVLAIEQVIQFALTINYMIKYFSTFNFIYQFNSLSQVTFCANVTNNEIKFIEI